jgi:hypothetical protein
LVGVNASEALACVGAYGLPAASYEPIDVGWFDELLALTEAQRMLPWLSAAVEDGRMGNIAEDDRIELKKRTLVAIQSTLAAHSAAASVVSRLRDAGVTEVRVLKGCATAYLDYAPLGRRFSSDVDLLVRLDDYDTALSVFRVQISRRAEARGFSDAMARRRLSTTRAASRSTFTPCSLTAISAW